MTFNIDALGSLNFSPEKQQKLVDIINKKQPDILCIQELSFDNLAYIKPQLDSIFGPCETLKYDDQAWQLRLYSVLPMRNFKKYNCTSAFHDDKLDLNEIEKQPIEQDQKLMNLKSAEFEVTPDYWVSVFCGHLRSSAYSTARRSMNKDASWWDGLSLYWRNYKIGKSIRSYEAENVIRYLDDERAAGMPVIVAGDFNDWCGSYCLETLMGDNLKDAWWEGGNGFGWTYFGWNLRLRLDHILYSNELDLVDVEVIDTDISDHKPIVARFKIK